MTKKLLFLLIALAALVVPDVGAAEKSITLTKDDFTKLDGSAWTAGSWGSETQVKAVKDGVTFHCFLRKKPSGIIAYIPDNSFISIEDNPNNLAFTTVALSFGSIPELSNQLNLYNITGAVDYGIEANFFRILNNKGYLTMSSYHASFVSEGTSVIDFSASPADYFFIARNEEDSHTDYRGEDPYELNSITFYYQDGGGSVIEPEIVVSAPDETVAVNQSVDFTASLLHANADLEYSVSSENGDPSSVTITNDGSNYSFSASTPGTYTIILYANVEGKTISKSFDITVTKTPININVTDAPSSLQVGESATFYVNVTPDNLTFTYAVTDNNGNPVSNSDLYVSNSGNQVTVSANKAGQYKITFSVENDGDTASSSIDLTVTERPASLPLTFYDNFFGSTEISSITFDSENEDAHYFHPNPFDNNYSFQIEPDDGGITYNHDTSRQRYSVSPVRAGEYSLRLYGTHNGQEYEGTLTIIVKGDTPKPEDVELSFSNASGTITAIELKEGETADFKINETEISNLTWSENGAYSITGSYPNFSITVNTAGSYTILFSGKTADGANATGSLTLNVTSNVVEDKKITFELNGEKLSQLTLKVGEIIDYIYFLPEDKVENVTLPKIEGLDISFGEWGKDYFKVKANTPGHYSATFSGTIDGQSALGTLEIIVTSDITSITFNVEPLLIIPADANSVTSTFTANPQSDDYVISVKNQSGEASSLVSVIAEDDHYLLTALAPGQYNVNLANETHSGEFSITVKKEVVLGQTINITIPASKDSETVYYTVPSAVGNNIEWTIIDNATGQTSSGLSIEKVEGSTYCITATQVGKYTINASTDIFIGSVQVNVTKEVVSEYTPITFYDGVSTMAPEMSQPKTIDIDDGKFSFAIWPNLKNDNSFKATVRYADGTPIDDANVDDIILVRHGGNTIDITPKVAGEYIIRLEGHHAYNFDKDEDCMGELRLIVTGTELTVGALPDEIYEGDIIELSIYPEDGDYTVKSNNTNVVEIIENDGKFSFKALQEGTAKLTVTRTIQNADGTSKKKSFDVPITILSMPTIDVFVRNPRQSFEPSEDPYNIWLDRAPVSYCRVKIEPQGDAPANGISIEYGDSFDEYLMYAKEEGQYKLIFNGNVLSADGHTILKISNCEYIVNVLKDNIDYNLTLTIVDKDGNEIDQDEFPMDETIYFIADPKSEDSHGYNTSYYPSNAICRYDDSTGIYSFDGQIEDLFSIFVFDNYGSTSLNENLKASTYKGKLNVTVLQSTASLIEFDETVPTRIKINQTRNLTITEHKYDLMNSNSLSSKITEGADISDGISVSRNGKNITLTGNKVGKYRVQLTATTKDYLPMSVSFPIEVVSDGTVDLEFIADNSSNPLVNIIEMGQEYYFKIIPAGNYSLIATVKGKESSEGITVTAHENGLYSVRAIRPEKYTISASGITDNTNEPASGSYDLTANKGVVTLPTDAIYLEHVHNDGYDPSTGHSMTEYTIEDMGRFFKDPTHIVSVAVTPVLDPEWAASYKWDDDKHSNNHVYYHGLWLGNSVLATDNEKLRGEFNENEDFIMYANVAGYYKVNIRTKAGYYTKDNHSFTVVIDPVIKNGLLDFNVPYRYEGDNQTLVFDKDVNLKSVEVFTGHWGDIFYSVEKNFDPARYARISAEDQTASMNRAKYSRMDLTDAKAVTIQQKVNGLVTPALTYQLSSGIVTSIDSVNAENSEPRFFTLEGLPIADQPKEKGIYIRVINGKSDKFIVR